MGTAPTVTEMRENTEINNFYIEEGKCVNVSKILKSFFKNNTDPIPLLHICTGTRTRRTYGPKIGFNNEIEINCLSFFSFYFILFLFYFSSLYDTFSLL